MNKTETDQLGWGLSYCQTPAYLAEQQRRNQQARALMDSMPLAKRVETAGTPDLTKPAASICG